MARLTGSLGPPDGHDSSSDRRRRVQLESRSSRARSLRLGWARSSDRRRRVQLESRSSWARSIRLGWARSSDRRRRVQLESRSSRARSLRLGWARSSDRRRRVQLESRSSRARSLRLGWARSSDRRRRVQLESRSSRARSIRLGWARSFDRRRRVQLESLSLRARSVCPEWARNSRRRAQRMARYRRTRWGRAQNGAERNVRAGRGASRTGLWPEGGLGLGSFVRQPATLVAGSFAVPEGHRTEALDGPFRRDGHRDARFSGKSPKRHKRYGPFGTSGRSVRDGPPELRPTCLPCPPSPTYVRPNTRPCPAPHVRPTVRAFSPKGSIARMSGQAARSVPAALSSITCPRAHSASLGHAGPTWRKRRGHIQRRWATQGRPGGSVAGTFSVIGPGRGGLEEAPRAHSASLGQAGPAWRKRRGHIQRHWDRQGRLGGSAAGTFNVIGTGRAGLEEAPRAHSASLGQAGPAWRKRRGHIQRHWARAGLEEAPRRHSASLGRPGLEETDGAPDLPVAPRARDARRTTGTSLRRARRTDDRDGSFGDGRGTDMGPEKITRETAIAAIRFEVGGRVWIWWTWVSFCKRFAIGPGASREG